MITLSWRVIATCLNVKSLINPPRFRSCGKVARSRVGQKSNRVRHEGGPVTANKGLVLPHLPGVITADEVAASAAHLASLQRPSGMIPWFAERSLRPVEPC